MTTRTARCCCGGLSIETRGEPVFNGLCHCDNCKRRTGSAFGWSLYFAEDNAGPAEGPASVYAIDSAAGGPTERTFCPACGTTVFWRSAVFAGLVGVAGGAFADASIGEPTLSATDAKRCAWLNLPDGWVVMP